MIFKKGKREQSSEDGEVEDEKTVATVDLTEVISSETTMNSLGHMNSANSIQSVEKVEKIEDLKIMEAVKSIDDPNLLSGHTKLEQMENSQALMAASALNEDPKLD